MSDLSITAKNTITQLKVNPFDLQMMSQVMVIVDNEFDDINDAISIVSVILDNLKGLLELLLPVLSVPLFAGDSDICMLKEYILEVNKLKTMIELELLNSALKKLGDAISSVAGG